MEFAKLNEYDNIGQVLITRYFDKGRDKPAIRVTVEHEGTQLHSVMSFPKSQEGFDNRDEYFEMIDFKIAYAQGCDLLKDLLTIKNPQSSA